MIRAVQKLKTVSVVLVVLAIAAAGLISSILHGIGPAGEGWAVTPMRLPASASGFSPFTVEDTFKYVPLR